ncbi:MAG: metal-sensitive transcriptional regulator [Candidatus Nitrosocosmicus sp.]|nr:metal-sensitive transcriptional regulator [Candidatus Nitrosocosmicus sp.]
MKFLLGRAARIIKMTHHKTPELKKRMARIEGHVKGIRKMLEEDKSYPEVVQQISAVRAALDKVIELMIQDLVEHYVSQTKDVKQKAIILELKDTVSNIL